MKKKVLFSVLAMGIGTLANAQVKADTSAVMLREVVIDASMAQRDAPLTLNTIKRSEISLYNGGGTYPEVLRNIGGVYATSETGSYGDAKINIRGFKQENFSVLLNGLPLSGIRSGSMFWNNWLGLTDATQAIQVQKGVGQSMLAGNALGGSINIITRPAEQPLGGEASFSATDYGQYKLHLSLASGPTKSGWAVAFTGSRTWGRGYVDVTEVNSWAYFLTVSKYFNYKHALALNILGSPENHRQRSQKLSEAETGTYGLRYNKNWGYYNGAARTISANTYHRPYVTLDWYFTPSSLLNIATTAYFSMGDGGGYWTESTGKKIINYRDGTGQIDWYGVYADNINNTDSKVLPDGSTKAGYSKNITSDYLAGNTSAGLKSSANLQLSGQWTFSGGFHYQYFYSWQNEKITDLLGGQYWYEDYGKNSLAGWAGRNPVKYVGDYIRLDNGSNDHSLSLFGQFNQRSEHFNAFIGGLFMANFYQRWDKYNYIDAINSDVAKGAGGNIKAGITYKLRPEHQLYINGGIYSRIPYSSTYFSQNNHTITKNVSNELNYMLEAGYRFERERSLFNINGYYSYWKNKAVMSDPYKATDDEEIRYMIKGLDAQHMGIELSYEQQLSSWLGLSAFGTLGHWQWKNDVDATVYDPYTGAARDTIRVYADGLMVGDAPQTQLGVAATFRFFKTLECRFEYRYNARMYANFEPSGRNTPNDREQPYRLPETQLAAIYLNYAFRIGPVRPQVFFSCNNLFNATYIERGDDGTGHDQESFRGYWGAGRNMQMGLRVKF